MTAGVEAGDQLSLLLERVIEVGPGVAGSEGDVLARVLKLDHEDVLDRAGRQRCADDRWLLLLLGRRRCLLAGLRCVGGGGMRDGDRHAELRRDRGDRDGS